MAVGSYTVKLDISLVRSFIDEIERLPCRQIRLRDEIDRSGIEDLFDACICEKEIILFPKPRAGGCFS
jgi:hypothetical protein